MSKRLAIIDLTVESLEQERLIEQLPELYRLRQVVENRDWHDHQAIFDHSLAALESIETIMAFESLDETTAQSLRRYLDGRIDLHTRLELLRVAVLFHDIGKSVSFQTHANGTTDSPSHGQIGAWVAEPLLKRLDLTDQERRHIQALIAHHLLPSDLIEQAINGQGDAESVDELMARHYPNGLIELYLTAYADWLGCKVRPAVEKQRASRITMMLGCLERRALALDRTQ